MNWIERATRTLELESQAIAQLVGQLDGAFEAVGQLILDRPGRVIMTGIGKSAIIAQKLVATSTPPNSYLYARSRRHPRRFGFIRYDVACIQKAATRRKSAPPPSSRAAACIDWNGRKPNVSPRRAIGLFWTPVSKEACPLDLAPTSSTAAQMAMGDALATCLMDARGFKAEDFAEMHPGGALGKRLYTRIGDVLDPARTPQVSPDSTLSEVVLQMSQGRCGATAVLEAGRIVGIITDGDYADTSRPSANTVTASCQPHQNVGIGTPAYGLHIMEQHAISQIIVTKMANMRGMVHLRPHQRRHHLG